MKVAMVQVVDATTPVYLSPEDADFKGEPMCAAVLVGTPEEIREVVRAVGMQKLVRVVPADGEAP